ncbi:MAG: tRNA (adenosine(37)-N6)-threonylcarbamoyltransferase complex dimerization subunit type 1 TsaB [Holosporaceae bacterium]|jgi:tRNA threonylcarbamoyl adenosine modification protein YeaZ|nr:tRNA (adenosine(37)-N6)-threonylcarbamoyltransferase complex dimerization subunit type 1 TsaB [Holosporaceae bacterium]
MKNVLAVSACLKRCSVAISYGGNLYEVNEHIDAAANLVWLADTLVKSNKIDLGRIDGIIAASGPGSFTGIRVALSFAKGLALALRLPATSVSYFDIIRSLCSGVDYQNVLVAVKGEGNTVYLQRCHQDGSPLVAFQKSIDSVEVPYGITLAGDAAEEIASHQVNKNARTICIDDFRDAKYMLNLTQLITRESQIHPYYLAKILAF